VVQVTYGGGDSNDGPNEGKGDEQVQVRLVTDLTDDEVIEATKKMIGNLNFYAEECLRRHITLVYGIATRTNEMDELQVVPFLTLRTAVKQLLRPTILIPRR
jgi:hypothetical protein